MKEILVLFVCCFWVCLYTRGMEGGWFMLGKEGEVKRSGEVFLYIWGVVFRNGGLGGILKGSNRVWMDRL